MIQKTFLAVLLMYIGLSSGFSQEMQLKEFEKEFTIDKRYLIWPVKDKAELHRFFNHLDGSLLSFIDIELAPQEPDHWYFTDLSQYQGNTILIHASLPEDFEDAFNRIVLSDDVPGMENVYHEKLRSQFHFSSKRGWNNDPNGLMYYEGEYHMFYQHNPYGWAWNNMHWGHAVSKNLVHWEELPTALYSDVEGYMYSGSGAVDFNNTLGLQKENDKTLICFYSSNGNKGFIPGGKMSQSIATSTDRGNTWTKYPGNPVLPKVTLRNRDPKVIWYEPGKHWVMSLYLDKPNDSYALFTSKDLIKWEMSDEYYIEGCGECPDIFKIPLEGNPGESRWIVWGARGIYKVGSFDGEKFTPESESVRLIWGNAYAGQTFDNAPDGRRIHIAWMANGNPGQPGMPFNQHMSLPIDFTLVQTDEGPRLRANPANEIKTIRADETDLSGQTLKPGQNPLSGLNHELYEIDLTLDKQSRGILEMTLKGFEMTYDTKTGVFEFMEEKLMPSVKKSDLNLRIFVDRTSIEIFLNDGEYYVGKAILPEAGVQSMELQSTSGKLIFSRLKVFELESIW